MINGSAIPSRKNGSVYVTDPVIVTGPPSSLTIVAATSSLARSIRCAVPSAVGDRQRGDRHDKRVAEAARQDLQPSRSSRPAGVTVMRIVMTSSALLVRQRSSRRRVRRHGAPSEVDPDGSVSSSRHRALLEKSTRRLARCWARSASSNAQLAAGRPASKCRTAAHWRLPNVTPTTLRSTARQPRPKRRWPRKAYSRIASNSSPRPSTPIAPNDGSGTFAGRQT